MGVVLPYHLRASLKLSLTFASLLKATVPSIILLRIELRVTNVSSANLHLRERQQVEAVGISLKLILERFFVLFFFDALPT